MGGTLPESYKHELCLRCWCLKQTYFCYSRDLEPQGGLGWKASRKKDAVLLSRGPRQASKGYRQGPHSLLDSPSLQCLWLPLMFLYMRWIKNLISQNTSMIPEERGSHSQWNGKSNWHFAWLGTFISVFLAGFHKHFFIQGYRVTSHWCVCGVKAEGCTSDVNWILWSLACPCNTNNWNIWQSQHKCIRALVPTAIKKGGRKREKANYM